MLLPLFQIFLVLTTIWAFFDYSSPWKFIIGFFCLICLWLVHRHDRELKVKSKVEEAESNIARKLTDTEEAERRRLAKELHDQIGQNLAVLGMGLDRLREQSQMTAPDDLAQDLDHAIQLLGETSRKVDHVMQELRPSILDDLGLIAAIEWYSGSFQKHTGISVSVQSPSPFARLPAEVETNLFRIVQGAMMNVAKHARANQVIVSLEKTEQLLRLTVEDDGIGMEQCRAQSSTELPRWGIVIMQERARSIGGELTIHSDVQGGTTLVVEVDVGADRPC